MHQLQHVARQVRSTKELIERTAEHQRKIRDVREHMDGVHVLRALRRIVKLLEIRCRGIPRHSGPLAGRFCVCRVLAMAAELKAHGRQQAIGEIGFAP